MGPDSADQPHPDPDSLVSRTEIDLAEEGVRSVIWCTGFTADFSWLDLPVFDEDGRPEHSNGTGKVKGIYFAAFPGLRKRKSGLIYGVEEDCGEIVKEITAPG